VYGVLGHILEEEREALVASSKKKQQLTRTRTSFAEISNVSMVTSDQ
jgi:hypothetical protein